MLVRIIGRVGITFTRDVTYTQVMAMEIRLRKTVVKPLIEKRENQESQHLMVANRGNILRSASPGTQTSDIGDAVCAEFVIPSNELPRSAVFKVQYNMYYTKHLPID